MKINPITKIVLLIMTATSLLSFNECARAAETISEAFSAGHTQLSFRYRYEFVGKDSFDKDANASTLKTRLNYSTDPYKGMAFFIEIDNVTEVFGENYNTGAGTSPGRTQYPVVADPDGTDLNQAWFNINFSDHNFKLGRQRIILDNQRFVGGVAWRQNEQTFDAATLGLNAAGGQLLLSYVNRVNRIFGDDVAAGKHDNNTFLANWSRNWNGQHNLSLFYYGIDNEDVKAFSTMTYGLAFDTYFELGNNLLSFGIDFANQSDGSNNTVNFNANYWRIESALEMEKFDLILGREVLEGNAGKSGAAFRTPLATLHAFNGWSDQFLNTPDTGLIDTYVGIIGSHNKLSWYLRYHDFESESTNVGFGYEIDASISMNITNKVSARLKYAQYNADSFSVDTQHLWFLVNFEF